MLATRPEKLREAFVKAIPFRRFAKPEEIATPSYFLPVRDPTTLLGRF
jgi:hypothetical protein